MLIILAGTSSLGKSTLSKALQKHGFQTLSIDDIPLEDEHGKPYYTGFRNEYLVKKLADEINQRKGNLVVDTLAEPDLGPSAILDLVQRPALRVLMYASPLELEKRIVKRGDRLVSNTLKQLTSFQGSGPGLALDRITGEQLEQILSRHKEEFANQADLVELVGTIVSDLGSEWIKPAEPYDLVLKNTSMQEGLDQVLKLSRSKIK